MHTIYIYYIYYIVSKAIVDLHESRIFVTSEGEGYGTTFTLDIPIVTNQSSVSGVNIGPPILRNSEQIEVNTVRNLNCMKTPPTRNMFNTNTPSISGDVNSILYPTLVGDLVDTETPISTVHPPLSFQYVNKNFLHNKSEIINQNNDQIKLNIKMNTDSNFNIEDDKDNDNNNNSINTLYYKNIIPLNLISLENFNISTTNNENISVISNKNPYDKDKEVSKNNSTIPDVLMIYQTSPSNNSLQIDLPDIDFNINDNTTNTNMDIDINTNKDIDFDTNMDIDINANNITTKNTTFTNNNILRILVVDDASSNRKLLCRLLKGKYITEEAEDGLIALNMILESMKGNTTIFDVVLIDYQMPNMDGPTSVKHMRDAGYNGLIIGITGNALPADIKYFVNQGANEVLTKPVKLQQLQEVISSRKLIVSTQFIM